ncbi:hypothetical protein G5I_12162 [Acromyrmex echinatior]|uniref:Uncharacterized protein n=1 Tax=Acromyrmex echinatior TaxID=103372 RepID=F4X1K1_ACREC|nr:hypothetical protein G5I_12162 [Acromyrmex echinatior]
MDPMDSGRRRKPSARLSCTGWSTGWKRLRRDERTSGTRTETVGRMADHPRRRFRGPPTSGGGDTATTDNPQIVLSIWQMSRISTIDCILVKNKNNKNIYLSHTQLARCNRIGNGEEEVVVGRSDGGSAILSNIPATLLRAGCRDKIIIPAIPGGRDDVPSGT